MLGTVANTDQFIYGSMLGHVDNAENIGQYYLEISSSVLRTVDNTNQYISRSMLGTVDNTGQYIATSILGTVDNNGR